MNTGLWNSLKLETRLKREQNWEEVKCCQAPGPTSIHVCSEQGSWNAALGFRRAFPRSITVFSLNLQKLLNCFRLVHALTSTSVIRVKLVKTKTSFCFLQLLWLSAAHDTQRNQEVLCFVSLSGISTIGLNSSKASQWSTEAMNNSLYNRKKQQTYHCEINEGEGELSSSPHLYHPSGELK